MIFPLPDFCLPLTVHYLLFTIVLNYYNYFTEIEETFIRRRGRNLLLSPLDWTLIETWQQREVPLHIILRGIEKVFDSMDSQPARKRSIKSLTYCRDEIEAQYADWLTRQAGKPSGAATISAETTQSGFLTREYVLEHIENSIAQLKIIKQPELQEDLRRAVAGLESLRENFTDDCDAAEKILLETENFLDAQLKRNTDPAHLNRIKKEVEANLAAYKNKMDKEAYEKTFDLMFLKRLREDLRIPRLSLFSL